MPDSVVDFVVLYQNKTTESDCLYWYARHELILMGASP